MGAPSFTPGGLDCMPCCFCASQRFTMGNIEGLLRITHGPPGCSFHLWNNNANIPPFAHSISTMLDENDVIFGGEEKLARAIREAAALYRPEAIAVFNTCVAGIIGDKTEAVCKAAQAELGIPVLPFLCEGFKDIPGFDYASGMIASDIFAGATTLTRCGYTLNVAASCYDGENKAELDSIFNELGYEILACIFTQTFFRDLAGADAAKLTIAEAGRPMFTYMDIVKKRYQQQTLFVNFSGVQNTCESLRKMAAFFDDAKLTEATERLIKKRSATVLPGILAYAKEFKGYSVRIFRGGADGRNYTFILRELGISVEFFEQSEDYCESAFLIGYPDGRSSVSEFFQGTHGLFYSGFEGVLRFAKYFAMEARMGAWRLNAEAIC